MHDNSLKHAAENRERNKPPSSNHVIWGMTLGILIGTAIGFIVFDNPAIGVAIGIVLGAVLSFGFRQAQKTRE